MRRGAIGAGLAICAVVGGAAAWGLGTCRPLDRLFGLSGCVGALTIKDLASLRQTLVFDPKDPNVLVAAGVGYQARPNDRLRSSGAIVRIDVASGDEGLRIMTSPNGVIERLVVSQDGGMAAFTCNRRFKCDYAPGLLPADGKARDYAPVAVVDLDAAARAVGLVGKERSSWLRFAPAASAPTDSDGRSADVRFSADGTAIVANGFAWSRAGDPIDGAPPAAFDPRGVDAVTTADGGTRIEHDRRAGSLRVVDAATGVERRRLTLDLLAALIPELHLPLALSPDGGHVAALSRRFSGPGETRALLQAWRLADGVRTARFEIADEVSQAVIFTPNGAQLAIATAPKTEARAATEIRFYPSAGDHR